VELQGKRIFSEIEKLLCILFDENTKNIRVGERVIVSGEIHIVTRNKKSISCLYSSSIEYENSSVQSNDRFRSNLSDFTTW